MSLKVELKPGERIIIGASLVTNGETKTTLLIDGDAPILREKDVMTLEMATTPTKRIYYLIQRMYLENNVERFRQDYFTQVADLVQAAPSFLPLVDGVNNLILTGSLYKALREARRLLAHEEDILRHV